MHGLNKMKDKSMKNIAIIAAMLTVVSTSVFAEQRIQATVVGMKETYRTVVKDVPVESCKTVEIPVYREVTTGQGGNTVEGAVGGAIVGGVIGQVLGGDKNARNAGAIFGAIVGGDKANKRNRTETVIVGYREQRQCSTVYQSKQTEVRGNNRVTVETNAGERLTFNTKQWYKRGTIIFLNVSL